MADQFAIPPRVLANGQFATVEQDTDQEAAQRVNILCRTPQGWLTYRPDFGLADQQFRAGGADVTEVEAQILALGDTVVAAVSEDPMLLDQGLDSLNLKAGAR